MFKVEIWLRKLDAFDSSCAFENEMETQLKQTYVSTVWYNFYYHNTKTWVRIGCRLGMKVHQKLQNVCRISVCMMEGDFFKQSKINSF